MADSSAEPAKPAGMSADTFLTVGICLVVASSLVVSARVWVNWKYVRRKLHIDDIAALTGQVFISATLTLTYVSVKGITQGTTSVRVLSQLGAAVSTIGAFAMWTTKAPILLFLLHNFNIKRWLRILVLSTLFVSAACFLVGSSVTAVSCTPHGDEITAAFLAKCAEDSSTMGVFLGIVSVTMDVAILIMPLPIVLRLRLPLRKRISLTLLFLTGILAIVASAVSLAYKWLSRSGTSTDMTSAMVCMIIECCIALSIGCAPAMYSFWTKFRPAALTWSSSKQTSHGTLDIATRGLVAGSSSAASSVQKDLSEYTYSSQQVELARWHEVGH